MLPRVPPVVFFYLAVGLDMPKAVGCEWEEVGGSSSSAPSHSLTMEATKGSLGDSGVPGSSSQPPCWLSSSVLSQDPFQKAQGS